MAGCGGQARRKVFADSSLPVRRKGREQFLLGRAGSGTGLAKDRPPFIGEPAREGSTVRCLAEPGKQPALLEPTQNKVHRLPTHERTAGQLGARQTGVLPKKFQAGVLRHRQVQRSQ